MDVAAANSSSMEMNGTTVQPVIEAGIMTRNAYLFAGGICDLGYFDNNFNKQLR